MGDLPTAVHLDAMIRESRRTLADLGVEIERLQQETSQLLWAMQPRYHEQ